MIFVTCGTVEISFERLLKRVIMMAEKMPEEEFLVQTARCEVKKLPKNIKILKFVDFEEIIDLYKNAEVVISAAGEVSVYLLMSMSVVKPILVPRLKRYGEHVDNQQLYTAQAAVRMGSTILVTEMEKLEEAVLRQLKTKEKNPMYGYETSKEAERVAEKIDKRVMRFFQ